MGVGYSLVNVTKREKIYFSHLCVSHPREIAGIPASAAIVCWYLLTNQGDEIQFVSDTYDDWPFSSSSKSELSSYSEVTDVMIDALISEGILKDFGIDWSDEDEPDKIYVRDIRNVWMDDANSRD